jgi:two-component system NarL family sensor kinase
MSNPLTSSAPAESRVKLQFDPREADEIIHAIRKGMVDALLIETLSGERVHTLHPFENIEEHNEILQAIRGGRVDALVIKTPTGDRVFSLQGSDGPYRILIETMHEGAATLDSDGTVLYANARFGEIVGVPADNLLGHSLYSQFASSADKKLRSLIEEGLHANAKGEITFQDANGRNRILRLALSPLPSYDPDSRHNALCVVATDVTELFEANESLRKNEVALQLLSARLLRFQDEERRRISRELHDSAGQYLAGSLMRLGELENAISSPSPGEAWRPVLEDIRQTIEACSREIRTLSYLLHPPTLDIAGLASALEWYCEGFSKRSGIIVDLEATPDLGRLAQELEITIYRIVQEGLTNIHRHSGSRWAGIRLLRMQDRIILEVADRGKGMGPVCGNDPRMNVGVGISGMRERVRQLNGNLAIESGPQGTTVRVAFSLSRLPLPSGSPQIDFKLD